MRAGTVWLVGMMGAGKSAVGAVLARRLGLPFVDTDAEVERRAGASIAALFASEGEPAFRKRERQAIEAVAGQAAVVALGGGAIAQPGAAERLRATGTVIWLRAQPETLLARIGEEDSRPLLHGLDAAGRLERLRALLSEREPHYAAAEWVVDTDGLLPEDLAARLAARLTAPLDGREG